MPQYYVPLVATPQNNSGGGGGSDLPAVSAADNGDVLTVVNGAWDKAAPGGGGVLVVTASLVGDSLVCGTTAGEMWAAINGGQNIIISMPDAVTWPVIYADAGFNFYVWNGDSAMAFAAASADDYPTAVD